MYERRIALASGLDVDDQNLESEAELHTRSSEAVSLRSTTSLTVTSLR